MDLDALINQISGRTKMLKKELIVERKEILQEKTLEYFNKDYMVNTLLIPEDYVDGFVFYTVENEPYSDAMRLKNITQATFLMHQLAVEYLTLKGIPLKIEDRKKEEIKNEKDEN